MSNTSRFTPASIEAFKRTAKDIQRAYPLSLQQSQEVLAKVYGYPDLHALQEHCKQGPVAGPFPGDADFGSMWSLRIDGMSRFYQVAKGCAPTGRLTIDDLEIFGTPDARKAAMDFESAVDAEIAGTGKIQRDTPTSAYVWFQDSDQLTDPLWSTRTCREGVFRLTEKGEIIQKAMDWLHARAGSDHVAESTRNAAFDSLEHLMQSHPNNPYPAALFFWDVCAKTNGDGDDEVMDVELAQEIWPQMKACRAMFDSAMPRNFRGEMDPKLVGNGAANEPYFALLYWGAITASALGHDKDALAWARRSLRFFKHDSFGARFIVDHITKGR